MKRQQVRKLLWLLALLAFPITIYYFSPYLPIQGALEGIISGSFITFLLMLIAALFFGRLFCGYLCPAGGLQECAMLVNDKQPKQGWKNNIKYVIWIVWVIAVILCFAFRNNTIVVDVFYQTDHGISVSNIYCYIIYYGIVVLIFIPSVLFGKRVFCHYFCWMAPFMVIGMKLGNLLHIRRVRLEADKNLCIGCKKCDNVCAMSLRVSEKVSKGNMDDNECILCGECVDNCPKKVLSYKFK